MSFYSGTKVNILSPLNRMSRFTLGFIGSTRNYIILQKKINFLDETYFHVGGYVNKQNGRLMERRNYCHLFF